VTYPTDRLWQEVVYVAYYLHWSLSEILDLEHPARAQVIGEIGRIHSQLDSSQLDSSQLDSNGVG
jgi:hypothetical protein